MTQDPLHFAIVIAERDGTERRELFGDEPVSIGRVQGNGVVLHRSNVSKRHARLSTTEDRFIITDLGSTNGTYVNRKRITRATPVREGDRVYIGDFMLRLERVSHDGSALSSVAPPPNSTRWPSVPPGAIGPGCGQPASDSEPPSPASSEAVEADAARVFGSDSAASADLVESGNVAPATDRSRGAAPSVEPDAPASVNRVAELVRRVLASVDDGAADPAIVQKRELERCLRETLKESGESSDLVSDQARSELFELGPVGEALADSTVLEIRLSGAARCELVRAREVVPLDRDFASHRSYELVVGRLLEKAALSAPSGWLVEGELSAGWRLIALSHGPESVLRLRRARVAESDLDSWIDRGALCPSAGTFLAACVAGRANILIVGADTAHGARLADALAAAAEPGAPCLVSCAEPLPGDVVAAAGPRRVQLDDSVAASPEHLIELVASSGARLVLDSLHLGERSNFVRAAASGLSGVVGLLRARTMRAGLHCLAAAQASVEPGIAPPDAVRELVAAAFDVVIEVASDSTGAPIVTGIDELCGADGQDFRRVALFARDLTGLRPTGVKPAALGVHLVARGVDLDASMFAPASPKTAASRVAAVSQDTVASQGASA